MRQREGLVLAARTAKFAQGPVFAALALGLWLAPWISAGAMVRFPAAGLGELVVAQCKPAGASCNVAMCCAPNACIHPSGAMCCPPGKIPDNQNCNGNAANCCTGQCRIQNNQCCSSVGQECFPPNNGNDCCDNINGQAPVDICAGWNVEPSCCRDIGKQCPGGNGDCCSGICGGNGLCQGIANGGACLADAQCQNRDCDNGFCACKDLSQSCQAGAECCSNNCQPSTGTCCNVHGGVCGQSADCCGGGTCTTGHCCGTAGVTACTLGTDCCNGHCEGSVCCKPNGAGNTCTTNNQCCSGNCVGGTCQCAGINATCHVGNGSDCCSGNCGSNGKCACNTSITTGPCTTDPDCCSQDCDISNGANICTCQELGGLCNSVSYCCAGVPNQICDQLGTNIGLCCVATGGACPLGNECCAPGGCNSQTAKCQCNPNGIACNGDQDCCSGDCVNNGQNTTCGCGQLRHSCDHTKPNQCCANTVCDPTNICCEPAGSQICTGDPDCCPGLHCTQLNGMGPFGCH